MKDEYLISYDIFCSRKRFNLENWISANKEKSYQEFYQMLVSLKIYPPSEDFFISIKDKVESLENIKKKDDKKTVPKKNKPRKKKDEKNSI